MDISYYAKQLGKKGGLARAKKLSSKKRSEIASLGAKARIESCQILRRINENFLYYEAVCALNPPPKIVSVKEVNQKLPGIYDK